MALCDCEFQINQQDPDSFEITQMEESNLKLRSTKDQNRVIFWVRKDGIFFYVVTFELTMCASCGININIKFHVFLNLE